VTEFFVVRHGESTWNADRRWQGQADPPLSERGERQALLAAELLASVATFDVVVTSRLQRARRTGELLAAAASVDLGPVIADIEERAAGAWEGLTRAEIERRDPGFLESGRRPHGYEDDRAIVARATRALRELAESLGGRRAVVVSHGGVVNALERAGLDGPPRWERLDNLEGRWFRIEADGLRVVGARVKLIDEAVAAEAGPAEDL
jgi:broad specificity phosphatase PhoE